MPKLRSLLFLYSGIWLILLQSFPDDLGLPLQKEGLMFLVGLYSLCQGLADLPMFGDDIWDQ